MKNENNEDEFDKIKGLEDIEEVEEVPTKNEINIEDIEIKENSINSKNTDNYIQADDGDEYARLASESEVDLEEKKNLTTVFKDLEYLLNKHDNIPKSINEVYEIYLENEFITKSHIKKKTGQCFLKFIFFFLGPLFGVIFLIGIFQMKSLMKALSDLIQESGVSYYNCFIRSNCNITISNNETSVFNFYDYYYNYSMSETIDFNLMLLTGFIGTIILKMTGFKISCFLLCLFNFGSIIWIMNFNFNFNTPGVFDYDFIKLLNLAFIYLLLLAGTGSSALLSHQILVESHLKYKDYLIKKIRDKITKNIPKKNEEIELKEKIPDNKKTLLLKSTDFSLTIKNNLGSIEKPKLVPAKTLKLTKSSKDFLEREEQRQKKFEYKLDKREKNKFDFFFMICLITMIGYLGKYSINLFLDFILNLIYGDNYEKRLFLFYIMIFYAGSIAFSILFYQLFKVSIFEYDEKEKDNKNKKTIKICQICGYIIYSETKKAKEPQRRNCCTLCCESIQNCCNETFCRLFAECDICDCEPHCSCKRCKYNARDYNKDQEVFRYCYKIQRKSFWCNKFMTNNTQKKIFPYMLIYFVLQLTTIGFEKQYEKYKNKNVHRKTWVIVFISTFILYFYFTLSFTRILYDENENDYDDGEEEVGLDGLIKKAEKTKGLKNFDFVTKFSNKMLNGTIGILVFNGVFSLIFSIFYLSYISEDLKIFFFEDNINIIFMPILMNKFFYFTLNYYCLYTAEKDKKFEIISGSSLISIYISIWNLILALIKTSIPDEKISDDYNYYNILYIIQIVFSSVPALGVGIFIIVGLCCSTGLAHYLDGCDCDSCIDTFSLHKFLFCFLSFIFCFGGLWIRMIDFQDYEYECCDVDECCDLGFNCCNVYCSDNVIYCDCCCCAKRSKYYSDCCYKHCDTCNLCACCGNNNY